MLPGAHKITRPLPWLLLSLSAIAVVSLAMLLDTNALSRPGWVWWVWTGVAASGAIVLSLIARRLESSDPNWNTQGNTARTIWLAWPVAAPCGFFMLGPVIARHDLTPAAMLVPACVSVGALLLLCCSIRPHRPGSPRCANCGYPVTLSFKPIDHRCPECGSDLSAIRGIDLRPWSVSRARLNTALVLLLFSAFWWIAVNTRGGVPPGFHWLVPTPVLIDLATTQRFVDDAWFELAGRKLSQAQIEHIAAQVATRRDSKSRGYQHWVDRVTQDPAVCTPAFVASVGEYATHNSRHPDWSATLDAHAFDATKLTPATRDAWLRTRCDFDLRHHPPIIGRDQDVRPLIRPSFGLVRLDYAILYAVEKVTIDGEDHYPPQDTMGEYRLLKISSSVPHASVTHLSSFPVPEDITGTVTAKFTMVVALVPYPPPALQPNVQRALIYQSEYDPFARNPDNTLAVPAWALWSGRIEKSVTFTTAPEPGPGGNRGN